MTLARRILHVLKDSPVPLPSPVIVSRCREGLASPRSTVWEQLRRMERAGLVVRCGLDDRDGRGPVRLWEIRRGRSIA